MAPEVIVCNPEVVQIVGSPEAYGNACDIWSLGIPALMLYLLACLPTEAQRCHHEPLP